VDAAPPEQDSELLERAEAELEDVERALGRLEEGSYGACEACGRPIGRERLAALPLTRRCTEHEMVTEHDLAPPAGSPAPLPGAPAGS
jgi:RNA polymerase-binding transcription factor DksA